MHGGASLMIRRGKPFAENSSSPDRATGAEGNERSILSLRPVRFALAAMPIHNACYASTPCVRMCPPRPESQGGSAAPRCRGSQGTRVRWTGLGGTRRKVQTRRGEVGTPASARVFRESSKTPVRAAAGRVAARQVIAIF